MFGSERFVWKNKERKERKSDWDILLALLFDGKIKKVVKVKKVTMIIKVKEE